MCHIRTIGTVNGSGERELLIWIHRNDRRYSSETASGSIASSRSDACVRFPSGNHLLVAHHFFSRLD